MPKSRKLSKVEINYIKEHVDIPLESLLEQLPDVDKGEVSALLTHLKTKTTSSTVPASNVNNASDFNAGNLMGKRDGMSVMTPAASELADARRTVRVTSNKNFATQNSDKIHTIRKN